MISLSSSSPVSADQDTKPLICPKEGCGGCFESIEVLALHIPFQHRSRLCPFQDCGSKPHPKSLLAHLKSHYGLLMHPCRFAGCSVQYSTYYSFHYHMKSIHKLTSLDKHPRVVTRDKARYEPYPIKIEETSSLLFVGESSVSTPTAVSHPALPLVDDPQPIAGPSVERVGTPTSRQGVFGRKGITPANVSHFPIRNRRLLSSSRLPTPASIGGWRAIRAPRTPSPEPVNKEAPIQLSPIRPPSLWSTRDVESLPSFNETFKGLGVFSL